MRFIACSGFPVPVSRYWREFPAVEIAETELGIPGAGTVGRWLRESPDGFGFSLLAPKQISERSFERSTETTALIKQVSTLAKKVKAKAVVIAAHPDWKANRPRRTAVRQFAESLPAKGIPFVIDLPGWTAEEARHATKEAPVHIAFDPLLEEAPATEDMAYMRLLGPAGHRSRYDDAALEKLATCCKGSSAGTLFCSFRNIDMYSNAKRLLQLLKNSR